MFAVKFILSVSILITTANAQGLFDPADYSKADAVPGDVKYRLFTDKEDHKGTYYDIRNISLAKDIHKDSPTRVLMHGFTTTEHSPWYKPMKDAYFELGEPCNILYVDWNLAGNKTYTVSAANVKPVGKYIAEFILQARFDLGKLHIIGHSLGSHAAGFVGKFVKSLAGKSIGRITATDPAWPKFDHIAVTKDDRLADDDALFVDIIHTDSGHFGIIKAIGHIDFYPNGGYFLQPGCPPLWEDDNCSHARSNLYFIKSITNSNYTAVKCSTYLEFALNACANNSKTPFGEHVDKSQRGVYYLNFVL